VGDVIKGIFIMIVLVLLAGLASAYTPEQQTTIDGMNLSFQLGMAYEKASQGQNVVEFNTLVNIYNEWIRQHFGEDANLFMSKINETTPLAVSPETNDSTSLAVSPETNDTTSLAVSPEINDATPLEDSRFKDPFKTGSELSKFGKPQVRRLPYT